MHAQSYRTRRAITAALAAVLLMAACQSTTSQTNDNDEAATAVYPDTADSPGLTDTSITIALPGLSDPSHQKWAFYGPMSLALKNLVDARNADGGIAGRTINPIWGNDAITDEIGSDRVKPACALSVNERSSFARVPPTTNEQLSNLESAGCVGPRRTINFIFDPMVNADLFAETPDVVAPNALDDVTAAQVLVERLTEQGFFDGAERVAVLSPGGDFAETAESVVVADLEAAGIEDPLVLIGTAGTDLSEAAAKSLVLQMKTEGVDRIVYFDDVRNAYPLITAMGEQQFTPPIGTLSSARPDFFVYAGYPADQISAVSWLAGFVTGEDGASTLASLSDTPASEACVALSEPTGLKIELGTETFLLGGCDILALLDEAFEASDAEEPSTAAFFAGLAKLTNFESAFGVTLDFSRGRAGATQVWDLNGDAACNCLKITGGPYPVERD